MNDGQSLFEVVVAVGIISVTLLVIISLTTVSIKNSSLARSKNQARLYSQEALEWLRKERDLSYAGLQSRVGISSYCVTDVNDDSPWSNIGLCDSTSGDSVSNEGVFFREVVLKNPLLPGPSAAIAAQDRNIIIVDVKVYWKVGENTHSVTGSTQLTKWR